MNNITYTIGYATLSEPIVTNFEKQDTTQNSNLMQPRANPDNIYKVGTIAYAKCNPYHMLIIRSYKQRIYYCTVVGQPTHKELAYSEAELIPPGI